MNYRQKTKKELIIEIEKLLQECDNLKILHKKDISELKQAEKAMYESEDRFRKIVEQAPIAMAIIRMDGVIELINNKAVKVFGYQLDDIPNMDIWWAKAYPEETYRKEVIKDWMERVQTALANGKEIVGNEYHVTCKDDTLKTIFIFGVPVSDKIFVLFDDITKRKKEEEALRESEERFSKALMTSPYAFVIANMEDGAIIEVNEAFTSVSGYTREEALASSTLNLKLWVNEEDRLRFVALLRAGMPVLKMETHLRGKNGKIITALFSAQVIQLAHKSCIISIVEDITSRKQSEEELRKSEERYRCLVETTDTGYVIIDNNGVIIDANQEYVRLSGHENLIEILGRNVIEWTAPEEIEKNKDAVIICMKNGYIRNLEITYIAKNDKRKPVEINATLMEMEGKQQILGLCHDITERKLAEEEFKKALERLDLATNAAYLGIWDWDIKKNELIWDDRMYQIYGISREDFTGAYEAWLAGIHPDDRKTSDEVSKQALRGEKEYNTEYRVVWPDGTVHHLRAYGLVIRDTNGKPLRMIGINYDITEHKLAEEVQKQMSSLLRATLESTADGILVVEQSGKVSGFNKKFGELWRIPQNLLDTGDDNKLLSFILDQLEDSDKFLNKVKELYSHPYQESLDTIEFKDGRIFERYSLPQRIEDKIVGRVWSFRDITKRKQTEDALVRVAQEWQATFDADLDAIWLLDINHKIIRSNKKAEQIFKLPGSEMIGKHCWEIVHRTTQPIPECPSLRTKKSLTRESMQMQIGQNWFEIFVDPILDEYGNYSGSVHIVSDITERRHAEILLKEKTRKIEVQNEEFGHINKELQKANVELLIAKEKAERNAKLLRNITDNIPAFIAVVNAKTLQYKFVNLKFTAGFNKKREDIIDAHISEIIGKSNADFALKYIDEVRQGKTSSYINTFEVAEGKRFFNVNYVPGFDDKGEVTEIIVLTYDVTDIKKSEQELLKAKEKAEESDRLKTAFLQNMSHEIRTPMNAIMGFSSLLVRNYNDKPKLEQFSEIINQRCNDLLDIINDILDIAKIESGQFPLNIGDCNLNELFKELATFFKEHQKRIKKQHIKFNLLAVENPIENTILTDKVKLKQIFINLIGNAFKFTDSGKIDGSCKLDDNQNLVFYVSDTGIGIPKDKHDKVFERFAQLGHAKNQVFSGTGLGLPIVKGLVGLMGGKIWLESEPDKGTTFYFSIPYKPSQSKIHVAVSISETQKLNFIGKTILVVEDDLYNLAYIKEILSNSGLNVIHTEYGKEAIQIVETQSLDLILLDIRLPDLDGYEVSRKMKQFKPNLKIIAQTAYAADEDKQKAIEAGCIDYISKPLKHNLLLSMINKYLQM